jgi:hypothetical protein
MFSLAILGLVVAGIFTFVGFIAVLNRLVDPTDPMAIRKQCILAEKLTPGCEILLKQEKKQ